MVEDWRGLAVPAAQGTCHCAWSEVQELRTGIWLHDTPDIPLTGKGLWDIPHPTPCRNAETPAV